MRSPRLLITPLAIISKSSETHNKLATDIHKPNHPLSNPRLKDYGLSPSNYTPSTTGPFKPWWTPAAHSHAFGKTHGMRWTRQERTITLNTRHPEAKWWVPLAE